MSNLLLYDEEEAAGKLNIDDLYERNMRRDLKQLSLFNKLLNRVHKRIQTCSRFKRDKYIWFTVPEFLFGEPTYDQADCISYIIAKLVENGFSVQYMHPHTLFVSWDQWIPSYVRNEVKNKTGKVINEKGQVVADLKTPKDAESDMTTGESMGASGAPATSSQKQYTPIGQYKPAGMIYNPEIVEKLEQTIRPGSGKFT
jgi:Family of unknown function (DUF5759)